MWPVFLATLILPGGILLAAEPNKSLVREIKVSLTGSGSLVGDSDVAEIRRRLNDQVTVTIDGSLPIVIKADEIESDRENRLNHFIGRVSISRGNETITCDRAVWNDATNTAEVSGSVRIATGDFTAMAERAVVNMDLQLAKIYDGRAFFPARNYYVSGALIERLGEKTIHIADGQATTCDGPDPAWTIRAENLTVTAGGYATATNMSFNSRYFPIFTAPYFMFPVKNERQTGLLLPFAANSSRDGFTFALPFFWATGENHDLTLTPVWRGKRGLATTLEGRYHTNMGKGIWQGTHLRDQDAPFFEYNNTPGVLTEAKDRYWLRAQNDWKLGTWDLSLDLDLVSDPLYLIEFRNDLDGFFTSSQLMNDEFGRTVNEVLDPVRTSTFYAQKANYDTYARGTIQYNENLYSKNNVDTIQKLPSLYYGLVSRPLGEASGAFDGLTNLPRLSFDMRYDYFDRKSNDLSLTDETGHRMILKPTLSWSSPVGNVATLRLSGDMEMAMYAPNGYRPLIGAGATPLTNQHDSRENRFSGALEASLSTTLNRIYNGGPGAALATRHQISPTINLNYVNASDDQWELPYWDSYDRRLSRKTVRYGLLNTFVSKSERVDENGEIGLEYFQFLKVGLWSSYEFEDNDDEWLRSRALSRNYSADYYGKGSGPVEIEIEAFFNSYFSARLLSAMNGRTGKFTNHDLSLKVQDKRGDSLTLSYDFDSPGDSLALASGDYNNYEEIRADLSLIFNSEWTADVSTRFDLQTNKALETHARLMYHSQCYGLGLIFSDSDNDQRIGVVIDLLGLGSINSKHKGLATPPQLFYQ